MSRRKRRTESFNADDYYKGLESVPPSERPEGIPIFPDGLKYFRRWNTLKWFLALMIPVICSAVAAYVHGHGVWQAVGEVVLGSAFALGLFHTLCSGVASSNLGTYFRRTEPDAYWFDVCILTFAYLFIVAAGFCM